MATRTYGQYCGLARALDVLGERWSLLVVRELALGPKRYGDLVRALPGIGTNLLAARLRALEDAGVVRRSTLPPPARVAVYELTESAAELRPVVEGLAQWGLRLLPEVPAPEDLAQPRWAALSMAAAAREQDWRGPEILLAVTAGDDAFWWRLAADGVDVGDGPPPRAPDVTLRCDGPAFFALATGANLADADVETEGSRRRLAQALRTLRLPERGAALAGVRNGRRQERQVSGVGSEARAQA